MPPHADVLQWEHLPFPRSLRDFQKLFPDDDACAHYLEAAIACVAARKRASAIRALRPPAAPTESEVMPTGTQHPTTETPPLPASAPAGAPSEEGHKVCTICGFTIDSRYKAEKPSINFSTRGRR